MIVYYHSVAPARHPNPLGEINRSLRVDSVRFRLQLQLLARSFSIVPLETLVAEARTGSLRRRLACVTLDDGYADNYEHAFPILRSLGIPATIFLTTQPIEERKEFFWERLGWYLAQRVGRTLVLPPALGIHAVALHSPAAAGEAFDYLVRRIRMVDARRREALLDALGAEPSPYTRPLTWREAASMQLGGITFGAHAHTHTSLPALSSAAIRKEIRASRDLILTRLGRLSPIFAYPYGDVDERTERIVAAERFLGALTAEAAPCTERVSCFRFARMAPGNRNTSAFIRWLADATGTHWELPTFLKTILPRPLITAGKRIRGKWRAAL